MNTRMGSNTSLQPATEAFDRYAFTSHQVMKLSAVTRRKLDYWIKTDVIQPSISAAGRRGTLRLFSFSDLIEIRTAVWLRDKLSLQLIRKIVERLRRQGLQAPLATIRFGVFEYAGRGPKLDVVMQRPDGSWESTRRVGQLVLQLDVPVSRFAEEMTTEILHHRKRGNRISKVERRRGTMGSAPVIAGTRVPIRAVWNLHAAGLSNEAILENYPGLESADVQAAIAAEEARRQKTA
jgi:uncharacterized protein (DUF433 family)